MKILHLKTWEEFKNVCLKNKRLSLQYEELNDKYELFCAEANLFLWSIILLKNSEEARDFETTYKSSANQPVEFKSLVGRPKRQGFHVDIAADEFEGIIDIQFDEDVFLKSGYVYTNNCGINDTISADVVLKDDPSIIIAPRILHKISMLPNIMITFLNDECTKFTKSEMIRITYTKGGNIDTARNVSAIADYFEVKG